MHTRRPKGTTVRITSSAATQPDGQIAEGREPCEDGESGNYPITFLIRTQVEGEQWQPEDARKRAGVGIKLRSSIVSGAHIVAAILRNSSAEQCGLIEKGDELISIEGESVEGKSMDFVASRLLGEEGTSINLILKRNKRIFILADVVRKVSSQQSSQADVLTYAMHFKQHAFVAMDHPAGLPLSFSLTRATLPVSLSPSLARATRASLSLCA